MFDDMRRLHPRGPTSLGVAVDADGAMLGPDFILVRRIAQGYRCITADEAAAVQDFLLGGREPDWLFRQCRRIAKALDNGEIALAQIIGLHIPIGDLDGGQLGRLARAASLIKANFDPDQSRIPAGQPGGGQWTSEGESAAEGPDGSTGPTGGSDSSSGGDQSGDGGGDGGGDVGSAADTEDNNANLMPVAYQGYYHDEVVAGLKEYLTAHGGTVITSVPLTAVRGVNCDSRYDGQVPRSLRVRDRGKNRRKSTIHPVTAESLPDGSGRRPCHLVEDHARRRRPDTGRPAAATRCLDLLGPWAWSARRSD